MAATLFWENYHLRLKDLQTVWEAPAKDQVQKGGEMEGHCRGT